MYSYIHIYIHTYNCTQLILYNIWQKWFAICRPVAVGPAAGVFRLNGQQTEEIDMAKQASQLAREWYPRMCKPLLDVYSENGQGQ